MFRRAALGCTIAACLAAPLSGEERGAQPASTSPRRETKVYGEWRIGVRPDKGAQYARLIEAKGLPLFREAGGRMVGWWTTLVGDMYEHLTIWEYDDLPAFEQAVHKLGKDKRFAEFVAERDPLLTGEENRFVKLTEFSEPPRLPERAAVIVHEVHRVPPNRMARYLDFARHDALVLLKKHGFQPAGPWVVAVGNWNEVTYLFRFESLAQREHLLAKFAADDDARAYAAGLNESVEEITTRILLPAPFAKDEKQP